MDVKEILLELGYNLTEDRNGWRSTANFRGGNNPTALKIFSNGSYCDFVTGETGSFEKLISLTLNIKNPDEYLKNKNFIIHKIETEKPKIKMIKIYPPEILQELLPNHEYWLNRGISLDTLKLFKGGVAVKNQQKDRYVFPIFNSKNEIIGCSGRTLKNNSVKWKHSGMKTEWKWPLFLNKDIIKKEKKIILIESPGDILSLWECNIKNTLCLFGTEISIPQLNFLLKLDPDKIYIALNNDSDNNNVGNEAALKLEKKLLKYFDKIQIEIKLPQLKDFNEMLLKDRNLILEWYKDLC